MADDDELYYEDGEGEDGAGTALEGFEPAEGADGNGESGQKKGLRGWLNARRGWAMIIGLALAQGLFALIMIALRSEAKPMAVTYTQNITELATDMLGYEVKVGQIYQVIPGRGGKRMTVGLDLVLILGQLPEERIEGSPRPTPAEMQLFIDTIRSMDDRIRSQVNILLQKIPPEEYGTVEVYKTIKLSVMNYINDSLESLEFGSKLRHGISKRRVTEVLLPMFVRQRN